MLGEGERVEKFTRSDGDVWRLRVRDSLSSELCHSAVLPCDAAGVSLITTLHCRDTVAGHRYLVYARVHAAAMHHKADNRRLRF